MSFFEEAEKHNQSKSYPFDEKEGKRKNRQKRQDLTEEELLQPIGKLLFWNLYVGLCFKFVYQSKSHRVEYTRICPT